ncbi:uncharacterized protein KY384_006216 [Bacidia gigantensis]|uniref:uncharacterized protein n=1 Tax=Bacidia gigantensis TaxID=2732470 RepID=UPI001D04414E|nr:uncharacterized protein KY384_006216 [Bacidia gigantensis]KAG8529579.1 hypothetical protein KY384_006216 [Bacidia gigantensis]
MADSNPRATPAPVDPRTVQLRKATQHLRSPKMSSAEPAPDQPTGGTEMEHGSAPLSLLENNRRRTDTLMLYRLQGKGQNHKEPISPTEVQRIMLQYSTLGNQSKMSRFLDSLRVPGVLSFQRYMYDFYKERGLTCYSVMDSKGHMIALDYQTLQQATPLSLAATYGSPLPLNVGVVQQAFENAVNRSVDKKGDTEWHNYIKALPSNEPTFAADVTPPEKYYHPETGLSWDDSDTFTRLPKFVPTPQFSQGKVALPLTDVRQDSNGDSISALTSQKPPTPIKVYQERRCVPDGTLDAAVDQIPASGEATLSTPPVTSRLAKTFLDQNCEPLSPVVNDGGIQANRPSDYASLVSNEEHHTVIEKGLPSTNLSCEQTDAPIEDPTPVERVPERIFRGEGPDHKGPCGDGSSASESMSESEISQHTNPLDDEREAFEASLDPDHTTTDDDSQHTASSSKSQASSLHPSGEGKRISWLGKILDPAPEHDARRRKSTSSNHNEIAPEDEVSLVDPTPPNLQRTSSITARLQTPAVFNPITPQGPRSPSANRTYATDVTPSPLPMKAKPKFRDVDDSGTLSKSLSEREKKKGTKGVFSSPKLVPPPSEIITKRIETTDPRRNIQETAPFDTTSASTAVPHQQSNGRGRKNAKRALPHSDSTISEPDKIATEYHNGASGSSEYMPSESDTSQSSEDGPEEVLESNRSPQRAADSHTSERRMRRDRRLTISKLLTDEYQTHDNTNSPAALENIAPRIRRASAAPQTNTHIISAGSDSLACSADEHTQLREGLQPSRTNLVLPQPPPFVNPNGAGLALTQPHVSYTRSKLPLQTEQAVVANSIIKRTFLASSQSSQPTPSPKSPASNISEKISQKPKEDTPAQAVRVTVDILTQKAPQIPPPSKAPIADKSPLKLRSGKRARSSSGTVTETKQSAKKKSKPSDGGFRSGRKQESVKPAQKRRSARVSKAAESGTQN